MFAWPRLGIGRNAPLLAGWAGRSDRAFTECTDAASVAQFAAAHRRMADRTPNSRRQPVAARQTSMNAYAAPAKRSRRPFICTAGPACIWAWPPAAAPHAAEAAAAPHAASASRVSPRAPAPAWVAAGLVGERRVVAACEPRLTGWDAVSAGRQALQSPASTLWFQELWFQEMTGVSLLVPCRAQPRRAGPGSAGPCCRRAGWTRFTAWLFRETRQRMRRRPELGGRSGVGRGSRSPCAHWQGSPAAEARPVCPVWPR